MEIMVQDQAPRNDNIKNFGQNDALAVNYNNISNDLNNLTAMVKNLKENTGNWYFDLKLELNFDLDVDLNFIDT